jgi:hypothetical protein
VIELAVGKPPYRVVLGAPHHAGPGVERIAEQWTAPGATRPGRPADELTGLTSLAVLQALAEAGIAARLVIAAHALKNDPNKFPDSAYWSSVFSPDMLAQTRAPSTLLFELHGAGRRRSYDLELSAGRNKIGRPLEFGAALAAGLPRSWSIAVQTRPGSRAGQLLLQENQAIHLENPALETHSLTYAGAQGIPALHLEMKSFLRRPDAKQNPTPEPPQAAWTLARAIAAAVKMDIH